MSQADLSRIPRTDQVAGHPCLDAVRQALGAPAVTELARRALSRVREEVQAGGRVPGLAEVAERARAAGEAMLGARTQKVINATGVLLHTNLGRAPLSGRARDAVAESAAGYCSLELDLATGRRGKRAAFAEWALTRLSGAEAALVVNNCAAAVLLSLAAVQGGRTGRSVIVSRGELIEIGGGFRVPEVLERSGARLVEVGTTNRTKLADYERALDEHPDTAAILRVHQGNFRQQGFVERPELAKLADLASRRGVPLVKDLGGGALLDLSELGLKGEPTVAACVAAGVSIVCFSTDKVLGGPQGGVLVGKASWVEQARRDPLARALRLGRLPLVALEATLQSYLDGSIDDIPVLAAVRTSFDQVALRAEGWAKRLGAAGVPCHVGRWRAAVGGGALSEEGLASAGVVLDEVDPDLAAGLLRLGSPPVLARIQEDQLCLDARSVPAGEDDLLVAAIVAAVTRARRETA